MYGSRRSAASEPGRSGAGPPSTQLTTRSRTSSSACRRSRHMRSLRRVSTMAGLLGPRYQVGMPGPALLVNPNPRAIRPRPLRWHPPGLREECPVHRQLCRRSPPDCRQPPKRDPPGNAPEWTRRGIAPRGSNPGKPTGDVSLCLSPARPRAWPVNMHHCLRIELARWSRFGPDVETHLNPRHTCAIVEETAKTTCHYRRSGADASVTCCCTISGSRRALAAST